MILFELCTGCPHFTGFTPNQLEGSIKSFPTSTLPSRFSHFLKELSKSMLFKDPQSHHTTSSILSKFLQSSPLPDSLQPLSRETHFRQTNPPLILLSKTKPVFGLFCSPKTHILPQLSSLLPLPCTLR